MSLYERLTESATPKLTLPADLPEDPKWMLETAWKNGHEGMALLRELVRKPTVKDEAKAVKVRMLLKEAAEALPPSGASWRSGLK